MRSWTSLAGRRRWDEIVPLAGGWAYLVDGGVAQLAIVDSQLPVEEARALVEWALL